MAEWFYHDQDGNKIGPLSGVKIKSLVIAEELAPETAVFTSVGIESTAGKILGLVRTTTENDTWLHPDIEQGRESEWSRLLFYTQLFRGVVLFFMVCYGCICAVAALDTLNAQPFLTGWTILVIAGILIGMILTCSIVQILYNFVCLKVSEEFEARRQTLLLKETLILLRSQKKTEDGQSV